MLYRQINFVFAVVSQAYQATLKEPEQPSTMFQIQSTGTLKKSRSSKCDEFDSHTKSLFLSLSK